jgi:hypothetical protein
MSHKDAFIWLVPVVLVPSVFAVRNRSVSVRALFTVLYISTFVALPLCVRGSMLTNYMAVACSFSWVCTCLDVLFLREPAERRRLNPWAYTLDVFASPDRPWKRQTLCRLLSVCVKLPLFTVLARYLTKIDDDRNLSWPAYHAFGFAQVLSLFLLLSTAADATTLLLNLLARKPIDDVWHYPFLATSPRDFWSRRWNRLCRGHFHRVVFTPILRHTGSHSLAAMSVFVLSGLLHDYLNLVAFHQASLANTLFFTVHGVACSAQVYLEKRYPGLRSWPKPAAWALNSVFFLATAPIFFWPYVRGRFWHRLMNNVS